MRYFELSQSSKCENPVKVYGLPSKQYCYAMKKADFEALEEIAIASVCGLESEEICDVLTDPVFMVSCDVRAVLEMYDKKIRFKAVQFVSQKKNSRVYPLYWVPLFEEVDCLCEMSIIKDNGIVDKMILDSRKIGTRQIFRIKGLLEYRIVISLPVAESILRRRPYGIETKRIETIGEV